MYSCISPCTTLITLANMSRPITLLLILALLLCLNPSYDARPAPTAITKHQNKDGVETAKIEIEEGCEGINEDECLMRRTLVAHIDYIYTQKKTP
ncbi:hypothetical protein M8C21_003503 [Ambrosia artemisiifolia]|uniref:Phytosulfokine n=1 Tax=Ambrosia artemisiifolia TaxID=4212 RepID=A0AAD5BPY0_AMBAR|nr:hypothetical protein M8C21_003503 [Ambrosia artemisiifolia]